MPVPKHVFDPPFNVIRSSHAVLDVTDLDTSRAFYETTVGLHVEDQDDKAVYLRGSEEHQHHSLVLRKAAVPACNRLGFKVGNDGDLDKAAALLLRERHHLRLRRAAVPGPHAAVHRSLRLPDRALRHDGEAPASAAALRPLQGLPSAAARPFQRVRRRGAGHRRLLRPARLPPDRICRGRRAERPHRGRLAAPQGQRARFRHHQRQGPSPAPLRLLGADRDEHPASLRRDGLQRLSEEHRARPRPPRHLQRVLPLCARPRRPPPRALHQRLFHHGPRPRAAALVAARSAPADAVGRAGAALLVRGGLALLRPDRCASREFVAQVLVAD